MARTTKREFLPKFPNNPKTSTVKAIIVLANTYAIAKNFPSKYEKYGYDFPEMIRVKVMYLCEVNSHTSLATTFANSILRSLNDPKEITNTCFQYLNEVCHESASFVNQKEYSHAYK